MCPLERVCDWPLLLQGSLESAVISHMGKSGTPGLSLVPGPRRQILGQSCTEGEGDTVELRAIECCQIFGDGVKERETPQM